ncbi:MAG: helix-turn-helix domain-containing protein [Verrucomicrobiaceae bacterium]|nr:helix-turn-helix domain-containing protein [Verrucomicrobiaceae bacterium]
MARPCITLNLENATLEEVVAMDCSPTKKGFRRFALRWLYEGKSREQVADLSGFSLRQVLRFIQAFNLAGLDGLIPGVAAASPNPAQGTSERKNSASHRRSVAGWKSH